MLEEMRIRDLGVIEDAVLEFATGLTVVTGETGAGKTMVVQGLGLLLGARADGGRVRPGAGRAVVEGRFRLPGPDPLTEPAHPQPAHPQPAHPQPVHPAVARAVDAGAVLDDEALLVSRTVTAEGRSRAHLGGAAVPAALLADVGADLVAIHGQADQQRLLRPADQRALLDRYAGAPVTAPLESYGTAYRRLTAVESMLTDLRDRARERAREADLLRFGLTEVEVAAPARGEDDELRALVGRLSHADALRSAASEAHDYLVGQLDGDRAADATTLAARARRTLESAAGHDAALAALAGRVAEVGYLLADVAADLAAYAADIDADPTALAAAQERQSVLAALTRKYGADVSGVLDWARRAAGRLAELDGDEDRTGSLDAERQRLRSRLAELAAAASAARHEAADSFGAAVAAELTGLAMPSARVRAEVTSKEATDGLDVGGRCLAYGPAGVDDVALLLEPHPGAPPRPLHRGASGGELSRVMLAVEVVLAHAPGAAMGTFVFDEVDAGVGGRAAVEVGRRLARLADSAQVIVVTHLPQVAAFADRHLLVEKASDGRVTRSGVHALDGPGRVRELSRMLAGQEDSALARGHAEELLAGARRPDATGKPPPAAQRGRRTAR